MPAHFLRTGCLRAAIFSMAMSGTCVAKQQDNTAANKDNAPAADQQKNDPADRDLAKQIRQSITGDKDLSTSAHNVKVIVRNGEVTRKGPVESDGEKATVESKATSLAGPGKVQNQLTVKNGTHLTDHRQERVEVYTKRSLMRKPQTKCSHEVRKSLISLPDGKPRKPPKDIQASWYVTPRTRILINLLQG
jgi:hypothetical protein